MAAGDHYRQKAADINAGAKQELNRRIRAEFENLAISYLRLVDQADRNSQTDFLYETPPARSEQPQAQQQQQTQPLKDSENT